MEGRELIAFVKKKSLGNGIQEKRYIHQYLKLNTVPIAYAYFITYLLRVAFLSIEVVIDKI